jgi:hypothetical protein
VLRITRRTVWVALNGTGKRRKHYCCEVRLTQAHLDCIDGKIGDYILLSSPKQGHLVVTRAPDALQRSLAKHKASAVSK